MFRKPESVLNSSICKLHNLLCPSQQIMRRTQGCLLGALLWKSDEQMNNPQHLISTHGQPRASQTQPLVPKHG